jgi:YggT family protein
LASVNAGHFAGLPVAGTAAKTGGAGESGKGPISMIGALRDVVLIILNLYTYVIIAAVIASWLVGFGVVNTYNQFARSVLRTLHALTEPVFGPIRRIIPPIGGLDLSPMIALLLIIFLQRWIVGGTLL